jgi:hypothetical protein
MTKAREDSNQTDQMGQLFSLWGEGLGGTEKVNVFPVGCGGQDLLNFDVPNVIPKMFCDFYSAMHLFSSEFFSFS